MIERKIIFSYRNDALLQVLPHFTVKRCPENFPTPPFSYGHNPYFLDFEVEQVSEKTGIIGHDYRSDQKPIFKDFKKEKVTGLPAQVDTTEKKFREILTLINVLGLNKFFQYNNQQSWVVPLGQEEKKMFYGKEFYLAPDYEKNPKSFEEIPWYSIARPVFFHISLNDQTIVEINLKNLIEAYANYEDNEFKKDFLNACLVLSKAFRLREVDPSASYLFMVSAIEALIEIEYKDQKTEHCDSCGQQQYKVSKKFKKFLYDYGFEEDNKVKNKFYTMRSKIAHSGSLLGMSYDSKWIKENQQDLDQDYQRFIDRIYYERFEKLAKTCFRYFLLQKTKYFEQFT
jgi:hypothetical protein